jgi:hypothetical protein
MGDTEEITHIYAVYCKDYSGITILKKAYKSKSQAYTYVVNKITTLLNIIDEEFKNESKNHVLPVGAQVIYTLYKMKNGDDILQYLYFKENYVKFFQYVAKPPVMFFVSTLDLI